MMKLIYFCNCLLTVLCLAPIQEIPPYETKPIMKASFIARIENNHTAFIRIRTNQDQHDGVLVLPVEVEVTAGESFQRLSIVVSYWNN